VTSSEVGPGGQPPAGGGAPDPAALAREVALEQDRVTRSYARLDELRALNEQRLDDVRRAGGGGTPAARTERDAFATLYEDRLVQLRAVEDRLVFGRMDTTGPGGDGVSTIYVGRTGLSDDDQTTLLTDWRAPVVEPFYRATAADPGPVLRRRHLSLRGRTVTALEDDVLTDAPLGEGAVVAGGGALMAAVNAARTGQMRDIVATLQAEQDEVVRAPLAQVLVVQGGPGTGKTAVALHRAAFLLYAHRDRIARSGVLVVGPNAAFLRYIDQVLPSLGETGVVMSTLGGLYPGVRAARGEGDEATRLKGEVRMAALLAAAVRQRQKVPPAPVRLVLEGTGGHATARRTLVLRPAAVAAARDAARATRGAHNTARTTFVRRVLAELVRQLAATQGLRRDELDAETRRDLEAELRESVDVRREVNLLWMPLDPVGVLTDLWARPERLRAAAEDAAAAGRDVPRWRPEELAALARERGAELTVADVPLLDELAELVGDPVRRGATDDGARRDAERARAVAYATAVLEQSAPGDTVEVESTEGMATAGLTAEVLAERWEVAGASATVAERAALDRAWTYGHVVVDEAQELSAMAWRVLARRCPSRSMTVVGDLAQTSSAAGAAAAGGWAEALAPVLGGTTAGGVDLSRPWHLAQLSVNYRTPRQVMELAGAVLAAAGVDAPVPRSVRDAAVPPVAAALPGPAGSPAWCAAVARRVAASLEALGAGRLAVIAPDDAVPALRTALAAGGGALREASTGADPVVGVSGVAGVKGLEFDEVVLTEPAALARASARGVNDLYVALTRPTQRLVVLSCEALPPGLDVLPLAPAP
jgi:DNA helicase IV